MADERERVDARLDALSRQLEHVEERLRRLESRDPLTAVDARRAAPTDPAATSQAWPPEVAASGLTPGNVALLGRTLVVLGGAYLFRAASEGELVPPLAGAAAAWSYAALWLFASDRSAAQGRRTSALFHGVSAILIGFPLVWEVTTRLELVGAGPAGLALCVLLWLAVAVAVRRELRSLAWVALVAHLTAVFAVMLSTHAFLPMAAALFGAALAIEALAMRERWPATRWPAALGIDTACAMLVTRSVHQAATAQPDLPGAAVTAFLLALPILYLGAIGARTLARARPITAFDAVQATLSLGIGLGGAVRVQLAHGGSATPFGAGAVLLGIVLYAFAVPSLERRLGKGMNFHAYGAFAGLLVLAGLVLALPSGAALGLSCAALAVLSVGSGVRLDRLELCFHGAVYASAAFFTSGLAAAAIGGLVAPRESWRPLGAAELGIAAAAAAGALVWLAWDRRERDRVARLPRAGLAAVALVSALGLAARWLGTASFLPAGDAAAAAWLASLRTVLLAVAAVGLAGAGRRWALPELHWLVFPILAAGAAKLVFEELRLAEPMSLFVSLAAYGGALTATPRLMRPSPPDASGRG